jgi:hypothetical protein
MLHNDKWLEVVSLLEKGLRSLPVSRWKPDLRPEATFDQKYDTLGRIEFADIAGLTRSIDIWLQQGQWVDSLSPEHVYCLRNRFFVSFFYARHIPFSSPHTETIIPFPPLSVRDIVRWYVVEWYEQHGMLLIAEGELPDTHDYRWN